MYFFNEVECLKYFKCNLKNTIFTQAVDHSLGSLGHLSFTKATTCKRIRHLFQSVIDFRTAYYYSRISQVANAQLSQLTYSSCVKNKRPKTCRMLVSY